MGLRGWIAGPIVVTIAIMAQLQRQPLRGIRDLSNRARSYLPALLPLRIRRVVTRTPYGNPLPPVLNKILRDHELLPGRLIVVGDVHGCCSELEQLLDKTNFAPKHDNLILAGDLVNKGPDSKKVLQLMGELGGSAHAVRGNHDDHLLSVYNRWQRSGGKIMPKERHMWVTELSPKEAGVLSQLPFTVSMPDYGVVVVHALLVPGRSLERMDLWAALHARNLRSISLGEKSRHSDVEQQIEEVKAQKPRSRIGPNWKPLESVDNGGEAWAKLWEGPNHVIFGHDARRRLQKERYCTGLDTGCLHGGELSAVVIPPLAQLRQSSPQFVAKQAAGIPLTLDDLQGELVSVPAAQVYAAVKRKVLTAS